MANGSVSDGEPQTRDERREPTLLGDDEDSGLPVLPPDEIPDWIGRYVVTRVLGRGGMSVVVSAYDPELERKVAIKLVGATAGAAEGAQRMRREAQALAKVAHPNVIGVFDVGDIGDGLYIAMEHVEGCNLAQWLEAPRTLPQILARFIDAGRGLSAAHQVGLVHRDFKPGNVLIGDDGRVRVVDFGLARRDAIVAPTGFLSSDSKLLGQDMTMEGLVVGTPAYMAPEQIASAALDARCDQFSYCVSLWEAATGARPFPTEDLGARYKAIRKGTVTEGKRSIPGWLRETLLRGMAPRPADRFPDMVSLLEVLEGTPIRRRRIALGALGVLAVGGITMIAAEAAQSRDERCEGGRAQIDEVYDSRASAAIGEALLGSNLAMAEDVRDRVTQRLDDLADAWVAVHRETCEATLIRQERSQQSFDETLSCLADVRRQVGRRVEVLRSADAKVTRLALDLVDSVGAPERCANPAELDRRRALQPGPEIEARVDALRQKYDASLVYLLGQPMAENMRVWDELLVEANEVGYEPMAAKVLASRANIRRYTGDQVGAEADFAQAFSLALGAGDVVIAEDAAVAIAYGYDHEAKDTEALRWLDVANALARRGPGNRVRAAELARTRIELLHIEREPERAAGMLRETLAALDELPADVPQQQALARVAMTLARSLLRANDPEAALAAAMRGEEIMKRLLGEHSPRYADAIGYRAAALNTLQRGGEALPLLLLARRISADAGATEAPVHQSIDAVHVATALWQSGRPHEAVVEAARAVALAKQTSDHDIIANALAAHCLALEQATLFDEAEPVCAESLEYARKQSYLAGYEAFALARLGRVQARRGALVRGRATLEAAWELAKDDEGCRGPPIATVAMALAWTLMLQDEEPERVRQLARTAFTHFNPQSSGAERKQLTQLLEGHGIAFD